jgi:hypothetical protein
MQPNHMVNRQFSTMLPSSSGSSSSAAAYGGGEGGIGSSSSSRSNIVSESSGSNYAIPALELDSLVNEFESYPFSDDPDFKVS